MKKFLFTALISFMALQTTANAQEEVEIHDPFEKYNRFMMSVNDGIDGVIFKPIAKGYRYVAPDFVEQGVSNFFSNLFYPTTIINQFLQGKPVEGIRDFGRFAINTTMGIGGIFDVASQGGLTKNKEDFGQTLAVWGVKESAYVVIPILGPSTIRDGIGRIPDMYTSPLYYIEDDAVKYSLLGASIIDLRARLLEKEKLISGDRYLFVRDAYLQNRNYQINDQKQEYDPFVGEAAE